MITSTSTAHVLNNRLGYWNQLTKLYLLNQTNSALWQSTLNKQSHLQMALKQCHLNNAFVRAFGQSKTFAWTSIKKYKKLYAFTMSWSHSHINWPCTNNLSSLLANARMPVVDQNHQTTLQASLQHCCQVNVGLVEWNPWDSVWVCITESSDRCVHKVAQPTHVAEW